MQWRDVLWKACKSLAEFGSLVSVLHHVWQDLWVGPRNSVALGRKPLLPPPPLGIPDPVNTPPPLSPTPGDQLADTRLANYLLGQVASDIIPSTTMVQRLSRREGPGGRRTTLIERRKWGHPRIPNRTWSRTKQPILVMWECKCKIHTVIEIPLFLQPRSHHPHGSLVR